MARPVDPVGPADPGPAAPVGSVGPVDPGPGLPAGRPAGRPRWLVASLVVVGLSFAILALEQRGQRRFVVAVAALGDEQAEVERRAGDAVGGVLGPPRPDVAVWTDELDAHGRRGTLGGWRRAGLPWEQT